MRNVYILLTALILFAGKLSAQFDERFYFPSKQWVPITEVAYDEVSIPVVGDTLNGIFLKPKGTAKATIFYCHGAGGNVSTSVSLIKPLVADGYQVFMIDFRGFGKSTGKPTHLNISADGQLVTNWLLERNDVKNLPLLLYGASMGTQVATQLAKYNPTIFKALILDGAISSFKDIALVHAGAQAETVKQFITSPYSAEEDIKSVVIPKLFIATKSDAVVPYIQSETVFNNAPEPKTMYIFEGWHIRSMLIEPEKVVVAVNSLLK